MVRKLAVLTLLACGALAACEVAPTEVLPTGEVLPEVPPDETPLAEPTQEQTPDELPSQTGTPEISETEAAVTPEVGQTETAIPPTGDQIEAARVEQIASYQIQLADGTPVNGQVVDLVVDLEGPSIRYVVVSLEGIPVGSEAGVTSDLPIPWDLVTIDRVQGLVTVQATLELLEQAPAVDLSLWPAPDDPQWEAPLLSYWGP